MIPKLRELFHRLLFDPDYFAARVRTLVATAGATVAALTANGTLSAYIPAKFAGVVAACTTVIAVAISQGEKNKPKEE